jgi:tRNA(Ser,Leu) C12 N-acetylase TAN1
MRVYEPIGTNIRTQYIGSARWNGIVLRRHEQSAGSQSEQSSERVQIKVMNRVTNLTIRVRAALDNILDTRVRIHNTINPTGTYRIVLLLVFIFFF